MQAEKKKETARVIKFVLFSASAGIIETLAMILCEEVLKIPGHWICYTIALVLSVLWNFTFNRKFTFQSAANVPRAMLLVFLFYVPFAPFTIWNEHFFGGHPRLERVRCPGHQHGPESVPGVPVGQFRSLPQQQGYQRHC